MTTIQILAVLTPVAAFAFMGAIAFLERRHDRARPSAVPNDTSALSRHDSAVTGSEAQRTPPTQSGSRISEAIIETAAKPDLRVHPEDEREEQWTIIGAASARDDLASWDLFSNAGADIVDFHNRSGQSDLIGLGGWPNSLFGAGITGKVEGLAIATGFERTETPIAKDRLPDKISFVTRSTGEHFGVETIVIDFGQHSVEFKATPTESTEASRGVPMTPSTSVRTKP